MIDRSVPLASTSLGCTVAVIIFPAHGFPFPCSVRPARDPCDVHGRYSVEALTWSLSFLLLVRPSLLSMWSSPSLLVGPLCVCLRSRRRYLP